MAECLKLNATLTELDLDGTLELSLHAKGEIQLMINEYSDTNIDAGGAQALAECLKHNTTITNLELSRTSEIERIHARGEIQLIF